ncbi:hypothetical protein PtA15_8A465 [Puccinia triticina]|nr:uncharacterized protein PtA15_8A465 [Puccinia triticina]WAQ87561.1 hypothetical protein PtA15_8A465 [Puccinia triticina]
MSTSQHLPAAWPPALSASTLADLQQAGAVYALANSLVFRLPSPAGVHAFHVPFTLLPSPFPRDQFEKAKRVQTAYNQLYLNIATSPALIREVLGTSIAKVDGFVGRLYELWEAAEKEAGEAGETQVGLGIFRNDFLLHQAGQEPSQPLVIKQVEFNTVSVSFGSLASKVSGLHRYIMGRLEGSPATMSGARQQLPASPNPALQAISKALAMAHQHYVAVECPAAVPVILMVVKPNDNNIFDQSLIEFELDAGAESVRMVRLSCHSVLEKTRVDGASKKLFLDAGGADGPTWVEVSVVYYRSMYGPEDFVGEAEWRGRYELERSRAINCPSLAIQLAGCKKFQQVLTEPGFIERHSGILLADMTAAMWAEIGETWTEIYALESAEGMRIAREEPAGFVLKPQREGGGNNIYGRDIPGFVAGLAASERESYILMRLIEPPRKVFNYLLRSGPPPTSTTPAAQLERTEVVSELGIYGCCLVAATRGSARQVLWNSQEGHVLRTKDSFSGEGGVAIGISCLDSPLLF